MKRFHDEQGEAFVETALVGLVVMTLALGLIQFGLWYHAQHVVLGAAQEGAHAAALAGATTADGEVRATELTRAGLGSLSNEVSVLAAATNEVATVHVEAHMAPIVPFLPTITLQAEGRAFRERFIPAGATP
ncbi:MAG: TadE family protein [Actinomycetota bacterium]